MLEAAGKIESLAGALEGRPVKMTMFRGETEEFALQQHRKLRLEQCGAQGVVSA